jgi:hypothetical protein
MDRKLFNGIQWVRLPPGTDQPSTGSETGIAHGDVYTDLSRPLVVRLMQLTEIDQNAREFACGAPP